MAWYTGLLSWRRAAMAWFWEMLNMLQLFANQLIYELINEKLIDFILLIYLFDPR